MNAKHSKRSARVSPKKIIISNTAKGLTSQAGNKAYFGTNVQVGAVNAVL